MDLIAEGRKTRIPDILDAIAALSSDAVPTPPDLARTVLDLLPEEVWSNPDLKWLDPAVKSGSILREIASRLMAGLAEWEPDPHKRAAHIMTTMLHGLSITKLHGEMGRRSVYRSKDATSEKAVGRGELFADNEGNIRYLPSQHEFKKSRRGLDTGRCLLCGAPIGLERGVDRENYAYAFIHDPELLRKLKAMKFDVIVTNPPYQQKDEGAAASATPMYHRFIQNAIALEPKYVTMIVPSRWFTGGKGLDRFRKEMLSDHRMAKIVDYLLDKDAFPGVNINGGVNYFLWDREHHGLCEITTVSPGGRHGVPVRRALDQFDVFIRHNQSISILEKVLAHGDESFASRVAGRKPFGFDTAFHGASRQSEQRNVFLYGSGKQTWVARDEILSNVDWVDRWKVLVPAATDGNENYPLPIWDRVGPFVAGPGTACSETYLVVSLAADEAEARNIAAYMRTKFFRFLVSLRKVDHHNKSEHFTFVPDLDMSREWNDADLYPKYGIVETDVDFIDEMIREMKFRED